MGSPKTQTVTQKTEIDPIQKAFLFGTPLPADYQAMMDARNRRLMGIPDPVAEPGAMGANPGMFMGDPNRTSAMEDARNESFAQSHADSVNRDRMDRDIVGSGGFGFDPSTGQETQPGGRDLSMRGGGMYAMGGIVGLPAGGMRPPMMGGAMPNLSNQDMAYQMAMSAMRPRPYAMGGYVEGPGTGTSDSIPAKIYQDGQPVQEAALSDGEFVMTERAVRGAGGGDPKAGAARMYDMMRKFEQGGRVR